MCLYPTPYYSCALSKLSDAVSNAHWLTFPNLTMLQPSCMPVLQLKISKLRYIRIQRWKAKRNNIYIHNMFHLYKIYLSIFPNNPKKQSLHCLFSNIGQNFTGKVVFSASGKPQGPENPNRTPSSSHPITNAAQAPVSHRGESLVARSIDPRRLQVTFRTFHRDPLSIPRVSLLEVFAYVWFCTSAVGNTLWRMVA